MPEVQSDKYEIVISHQIPVGIPDEYGAKGMVWVYAKRLDNQDGQVMQDKHALSFNPHVSLLDIIAGVLDRSIYSQDTMIGQKLMTIANQIAEGDFIDQDKIWGR